MSSILPLFRILRLLGLCAILYRSQISRLGVYLLLVALFCLGCGEDAHSPTEHGALGQPTPVNSADPGGAPGTIESPGRRGGVQDASDIGADSGAGEWGSDSGGLDSESRAGDASAGGIDGAESDDADGGGQPDGWEPSDAGTAAGGETLSDGGAVEDAANDLLEEDGQQDDAPESDAPESDGTLPEEPKLEAGAPCEASEECASGWCLNGGGVCAAECEGSGCPDGEWCAALDAGLVCLPMESSWCGTCASHADCNQGSCLLASPGQGECALPCGSSGECPSGFVCEVSVWAETEAPAPAWCRPAGGDCACALLAMNDPAPDACQNDNEWGSCEGVWMCGLGGTWICGAAVPAQEVCNILDDDCDGNVDEAPALGCAQWYSDADGDGFAGDGDAKCLCAPAWPWVHAEPLDCDDEAANVFPGNEETCDGLDNNCDGQVDPPGSAGCTVWYADVDGDGFGTGNGACLCETASPFTAVQGGDCDDSNAGISPAATESCNGIDDDCDGIVDPPGAAGCAWWFADADGDGYGDSTDTKCLCEGQAPYMAGQGGDCDDTDPQVHPGASEICNTIDDNCDGVVDPMNAPGCKPRYQDKDGDGYGVDSLCLCAPSWPWILDDGGDCDDNDPLVYPGAISLCGEGACQKSVQNCVDGAKVNCTPFAVPANSCNAPPAACKTTTTGVDACGNPCTKVGPAQCFTVHPACLTSNPGAPTDTATCKTPTGDYDCGRTACPAGFPNCGAAACDSWPNTIGADCTYCKLLSCQKKSGKDRAQFECKNIPTPSTL